MPTKKVETAHPQPAATTQPDPQVKKGDPNKIRCPHDHHICTRQSDGRGGLVYKCPRCNRIFS